MYSNILIAVDPDDPGSWSRALPVAVALGRCFSARLILCAVVRDVDAEREAQWSPIRYREMIDHAHLRLRILAEQAGDLPVSVEVGTGTIAGAILEIAERNAVDLIVLASHRPGLRDYVRAANAARVARRADCSVLIVRDDEPEAAAPLAGEQAGREIDVR